MTWEMRRHRDPLWWIYEFVGWLEGHLGTNRRK